MLVIGIDPGTATTGFGVVCEDDKGHLAAVEYGIISTASKMPLAERLLLLHQQLVVILQTHQPACGVVEKLFFQRNVRTAIAVGQSRGVILLSLAESQIPVFEYAPNEIKQAVAGYGGADKSQVQQMVRAILELDEIPRPDDAADALAIAICHLHSRKIQALAQE